MLRFALLLACTTTPPAVAQESTPNVLLVIADDFGVDLVSAYGEGTAPPCTPTIDGLAAEGMLFRNAWAYPTCSPTRASLLTGRYGFRTGIGTVGGGNVLANSETTLAEALRDSPAGYTTAALGKWHLGGNNLLHPNTSGFGHYAGPIGGGVQDYSSWTKTTNGVTHPQPVTTYVTVDTTEDALAAVATLPEPWFVYVAYNAPHTPVHSPPTNLCPPASLCPNAACGNLGPGVGAAQRVKAMVEVMDDQFGRLLAAVDPADTYVVFMGDNGTTGQASEPPFSSQEAKGSVLEGGVNVPLVVRGPGVAAAETAALVGATDLFATIGDLTGTGIAADDSVSFAPVLADPAARPRKTLYSERFEPNGSSLPIADHDYVVRDERYKLVVRAGDPDRLYDLIADPFEANTLVPSADPQVTAAYERLVADLQALHSGADFVASPAQLSLSSGGTQQLVLAPGQASAGDLHLVVGSASGTSPGVNVDGLTVALQLDAYTLFTLNGANGAVFQGTLGTVSDQGTALAALALPPGLEPAFAGLVLHHAYLLFDTSSATATFASESLPLTLAP